jgi:hypothetical protein
MKFANVDCFVIAISGKIPIKNIKIFDISVKIVPPNVTVL